MQIIVDYDGANPRYLCGTRFDIPLIMTFDAYSVYLTFHTDSSITRRGFHIAYKIISRKGLPYGIVLCICGHLATTIYIIAAA